MSANVPSELAEMGDPEDVAPMVVFLLSDQAKHVTGQVYTVVGSKIAVWNQPAEVRAMWADGRWTPEQIAARLDGTVGQERMSLIDRLEQMRQAAASGRDAQRLDRERRPHTRRCRRGRGFTVVLTSSELPSW